jgi:multiple sugar transport system substrate-binding protein
MVHTPAGRPSGTLGGWGLGISAYSRDPDLALAFIREAVTLEAQLALCGPTGYAPARIEAYEDERLLAQNAFLAELLALHANAVARPGIARYALASDILQRQLSSALSGAKTPAAAMRQAASETRAMLGTVARDAGAGVPRR